MQNADEGLFTSKAPFHSYSVLDKIYIYTYIALKANYQLIYKHPVFSAFHFNSVLAVKVWLWFFQLIIFSITFFEK